MLRWSWSAPWRGECTDDDPCPPAARRGERCDEHREEEQHGERRFQNGETAEGVAEGTGGDEKDCEGRAEWRCEPPNEHPCKQKNDSEDAEHEDAGGDDAYSGEVKDDALDERPYGKGGGSVEVAGDVPVAQQEMADCGVAVPAFVGVFDQSIQREPFGKSAVRWRNRRRKNTAENESNRYSSVASGGRRLYS